MKRQRPNNAFERTACQQRGTLAYAASTAVQRGRWAPIARVGEIMNSGYLIGEWKMKLRNLLVGFLCAATLNASAAPSELPTRQSSKILHQQTDGSVRDWKEPQRLYTQVRETCFLTGEKTDGMNKICFYDCPSGAAATTVSAASLCPISIRK